MINKKFDSNRTIRHKELHFDFVIVGGGMTGVCAAISAARKGLKVALIQNRPILGGVGSSEIRVWMLGATSHMGNNNRWAREGGIVDEILVENTYRNKEGNPVLFDMVLIDKVKQEKNISLFLNTTVHNLKKENDQNITYVEAFNSSSETKFTFYGKLFCDATGDGVIAYLAGVSYRKGAEDKAEFDEKFAPDKDLYGEKLGSSLLFYFKDTDKPIKYTAPDFAMKKEDIEKEIYRVNNPNYFDPINQMGCKYWWIEYGGRIDTIHDDEEIKYTLWKVAYGIWDYIKNSGKYPEAKNKTLEWVGLIPGKRESRRFVGPYMLTQKDIIEQRTHYDAVTFGGWSIDLHPADGVFSSKNASTQWHSKGIYQIPYRCYITDEIDNLFFGGRLISASHVAFASTRVMLTSGAGGEVIGAAAAICLSEGYTPIDLTEKSKIGLLQQTLIKTGNYIPQLYEIPKIPNLAEKAQIKPSSELTLSEIPSENGIWRAIKYSVAQMLPITAGKVPSFQVNINASESSELKAELRISSKSYNHTPDTLLRTKSIPLRQGIHEILIDFNIEIESDCYVFLCFMSNPKISLLFSQYRITALVSVFNTVMPDVSNWGKQNPTEDIGIEKFEFWCPERRPNGQNIAMKIHPPIEGFEIENILHPIYRPVEKSNAWVVNLDDNTPSIEIKWDKVEKISKITFFLDSDYDHPMETIQWGHHDNKMPFCVDCIEVYDGNMTLLKKIEDNHRTKVEIHFEEKIETDLLNIKLYNSIKNIPVSVFGINIV